MISMVLLQKGKLDLPKSHLSKIIQAVFRNSQLINWKSVKSKPPLPYLQGRWLLVTYERLESSKATGLLSV